MRIVKAVLKKIMFYPPVARRLVKLSLISHNKSYQLCGMLSSALEPDGLHPKHRLMKYHDWFVEKIEPEWTVLDVGCGNGALTYDLSSKAKRVIAIDINSNNINCAKQQFKRENITYIIGDATVFNFKANVDVIVLSNVLEHIQNRMNFLKKLSKLANRFLIRVPMLEREWLIPYKKELGIEWRLDATHKTEYTEDEFRNELANADLDMQKITFRWGEMYAVAVPSLKGSSK